MLIRVKNKTTMQIAVPAPIGGFLVPLAQTPWIDVTPEKMEKATDFHTAVLRGTISYQTKENPAVPGDLEAASANLFGAGVGLSLTIGGEGALAEVNLTAATLDLGTVVNGNWDTALVAATGGVAGNAITVAAVADGVAKAGTVARVGTAFTFHFQPGVSTVADMEALITGLAGGDDLINIGGAGTGATVLIAGDAFAATSLAGGLDAFTDANEMRVSGQVVDASGASLAGARNVVLTTRSTGGAANITALTGTTKLGAGSTNLWLQTDANGAFTVKVANTATESVLLSAEVDGGTKQLKTLTFV